MSKLILKKGRDRAIRQRHHWIFSGAILKKPDAKDGEIVSVLTEEGELLGHAYYNSRSPTLTARMVSFGQQEPTLEIKKRIIQAIDLRKSYILGNTTGYRLINGEGDLLPGLVVDVYGDHLVLQLSTLGMEKLKNQVVEYLIELVQPLSIYEKSISGSRKEEGLKPQSQQLFGITPDPIVITENGISFYVSVQQGQKTGFFLDQRENRRFVGEIAKSKRVCNVFSYTGGFSLYALANGASHVTSIDSSKEAIEMVERQIGLNGFDKSLHTGIAEDAFTHFREVEELNYDLVILDPPALAKKQTDQVSAARAYKDLNRIVLKKMAKNSVLLTCSCSYPVDEKLFQTLLFQAALEAKREVKIIRKHPLALDHPINICHPEGNYLKSLTLYVQ